MSRDDVAARLLIALERCDDLALAGALHPDARMVVDAGDKTGGELEGRARVIRRLKELLTRHPDAALEAAHANGRPALALRRRQSGEVIGVLAMDADAAAHSLWLTTAPAKLVNWNRRRPEIE
ncbi:MAG TPA: hypothetical protein VI121_01950 [Agromyces sp.]